MCFLTLFFPGILLGYGNPEVGLIASGFLGLYLTALAYVAIGNFTSALTANQIIAAVSALVVCLSLFVIHWPAESAPEPWKSILLYLSVTEHFTALLRGILDTKSLVYFASLVTLFLFLTLRAVESARWR
jgi:ABC-2 type transport system permease protein